MEPLPQALLFRLCLACKASPSLVSCVKPDRDSCGFCGHTVRRKPDNSRPFSFRLYAKGAFNKAILVLMTRTHTHLMPHRVLFPYPSCRWLTTGPKPFLAAAGTTIPGCPSLTQSPNPPELELQAHVPGNRDALRQNRILTLDRTGNATPVDTPAP